METQILISCSTYLFCRSDGVTSRCKNTMSTNQEYKHIVDMCGVAAKRWTSDLTSLVCAHRPPQ